jgi:hypothetical protein
MNIYILSKKKVLVSKLNIKVRENKQRLGENIYAVSGQF